MRGSHFELSFKSCLCCEETLCRFIGPFLNEKPLKRRMSQKTTRRARRQTIEEDPSSFKSPKNDPEEESQDNSQPSSTTPTIMPNITQQEVEQNGTDPEDTSIVTRSRSATPQVKKTPTQNGHDEDEKLSTKEVVVEKPAEDPEELNTSTKEQTDIEMDPLIVSDEPDPELLFEETSEPESGKSSPVISRCKTRRSQTRNIPTPKTPKSLDEIHKEEEEEKEEDEGDINASYESCTDNASTNAEAGGDSTRLEYTSSNMDGSSFLQGAKEQSFGETLRCLSTRRTIRPISDEYRRKLMQLKAAGFNNKSDLGTAYPSRNSVERVALKRKNCEGGGGAAEDEMGKRFKSESPSFFQRLASPLSSIRNTFRSEIPTSTPKLTGYKDEKFLLEEEGVNSQMCEVGDGERRWCSIM